MDTTARAGLRQLETSYHALLEEIVTLHNSHASESQRQELADSIQLRLRELGTQITAVELELEDSTDNTHEVALDRMRENFKLAKNRFRNAQIQAKKNAELSWKEQREQLFANAQKDSDKNKSKSVEDRAVGKAEDITATLRRVHQMATTEVVKSEINIEELDYSTRSLMELGDKYNAVDLLLAGSTRLVKHLEQADKRDRQYMMASLSFLGATLAWIVWRRILKAPVMLLLWTVFKVLGIARFFGGFFTESVVDVEGVDVTETVSTVIGETVKGTISVITETLTAAASEATGIVEDVAQALSDTIAHNDL